MLVPAPDAPAAPGAAVRDATPAQPPRSALDLLARSDAELVAASFAGAADERFVHAHLGALRAAAAVLAVTGRPTRRGLRTVWQMVAAAAPELEQWAAWFADGAALRAAIESGRAPEVADERADRTLEAAEDFQDAVRAWLHAPAEPRASLVLRAS